MSDRRSRSVAKSYVAQEVRPILRGRVVWRAGMPQPVNLRPRRAPGKAALARRNAANRAGSAEQTEPARTDTGEFRPGEPQPAPERPTDAGPAEARTGDMPIRARAGVVVRVAPYAERGRIASGAPADGPERAGKTWDWFVNATAWDWYTNSSGKTDRGDAEE
ncbi:hypothetical protein VMT65_16415 [Nocardia sp. CDC153]|uniref:hypothetical protein n=1 Tax=Nocardia sp. CDC153 TaxID=3112167 RepID=UPI002DBBD251|nr:hypothetical protein [Nocardia sp. CDC153]MEC3954625.1 hypothetical protein [Nocardia sp. CDC153]